MNGALEWITEHVLDSLRGEEPTPQGLTFLLRRYATTGRADLSEALGPALAEALDRNDRSVRLQPDQDRGAGLQPVKEDAAQWLMLFVEAAGLTEDERLKPVAAAHTAALAGSWPSRGRVSTALRGVEACLSATRLEQPAADARTAIDELERIVSATYVPGDGLGRMVNHRERSPGDLSDHAAAASALITAFGIAGRLPYSMLAEELMQFARRSWWNEQRGGFHPPVPNAERTSTNDLFVANCEAARVLCRLAALHRDVDYRQAAVIAEQSDYADDATRTLDSLADEYRAIGPDVAIYGLALTEHEALLRWG